MATFWILVSAVTRRLQTLQARRSLKGLRRLSLWMQQRLPGYQGRVLLPSGVRLHIDTHSSAERWLLISGVYHPAVTRWLRGRVTRGAHCVDAGANLGYFTVHLAHWAGPDGRVAAFEPNPAMAQRVRDNVALNGHDHTAVVENALHSSRGTLTFYLAADPAKSSLDAPPDAADARAITVPATTLDAFMDSAGWPRLDVVKIDTEGNDCAVLLGAAQSLRRFRPAVVFEYKYSTPPDAAAPVFALFDELGYRLEAVTYDGRRFPFHWREAPAGYKQADVLCEPPP